MLQRDVEAAALGSAETGKINLVTIAVPQSGMNGHRE
jgi:hypothetical protein